MIEIPLLTFILKNVKYYMQKIENYLIIILLLFLCVHPACSGANEDGHNFNKKYLTPAMFKMLGMLNEYISRFNYETGKPWKDLVERFYPNEPGMEKIFEELIKQYQREVKKNFNYHRTVGKQGHVYFYSKYLSKVINSFYIMKGRYATLNSAIFSYADNELKLAFIEGVYLRYGYKNANLINMANALNKMETIGSVLRALNCNNVYIYITTETIPQCFEIIFEPGDRVKTYLKIENIRSKGHYENSKLYHYYKEIR